jgi:hypothetical protein
LPNCNHDFLAITESSTCRKADDVILPGITTAFTGLRPVEARKTENPPAATPVQRFVILCSNPISLSLSQRQQLVTMTIHLCCYRNA